MTYAQTNLQLFDQLARAGYCPADRARVVAAYTLAMRLFSGWYRGSGKTFVAHLVGTASILAQLQAKIEIVMAGLLHAAYSNGEFAAGNAPSSVHREAIIAVAGVDVELLVRAYWEQPWDGPAIDEFAAMASVDGLSALQRDVLFIRLANELEDHLDLAALYSAGPTEGRRWAHAVLPRARTLADLLGEPVLAAELQRVLAETIEGDVAAAFGAQAFSQLLLPKYPRLGMKTAVARWIAKSDAGRDALRIYGRTKRRLVGALSQR